MKDFKVRETITIVIEGPSEDVAHSGEAVLSHAAMTINDAGGGRIRYRIQSKSDFLDDNWDVIPIEAIRAEALRRKKSGGV